MRRGKRQQSPRRADQRTATLHEDSELLEETVEEFSVLLDESGKIGRAEPASIRQHTFQIKPHRLKV
jgi:hypothetical protein